MSNLKASMTPEPKKNVLHIDDLLLDVIIIIFVKSEL